MPPPKPNSGRQGAPIGAQQGHQGTPRRRQQAGTGPARPRPQARPLRNATEMKCGVLEPEPGVVIRILELPNTFFGAYRILPNSTRFVGCCFTRGHRWPPQPAGQIWACELNANGRAFSSHGPGPSRPGPGIPNRDCTQITRLGQAVSNHDCIRDALVRGSRSQDAPWCSGPCRQAGGTARKAAALQMAISL